MTEMSQVRMKTSHSKVGFSLRGHVVCDTVPKTHLFLCIEKTEKSEKANEEKQESVVADRSVEPVEEKTSKITAADIKKEPVTIVEKGTVTKPEQMSVISTEEAVIIKDEPTTTTSIVETTEKTQMDDSIVTHVQEEFVIVDKETMTAVEDEPVKSTEKESTKEEATKEEATKEESIKEESIKEESTKEDSTKEESTKEEATKEEATRIKTEEEVTSLSIAEVPTATITEPAADTQYAASSADENDIGTPENEPVASIPTFRSYDDIPEFIPQQKQQPTRKRSKKSLTRIQLIEQQRQNHTPTVNARCNHWPRCTNKHCKYWHPFKMCRAGDSCYYGKKCMFVHPSDYLEQPERKNSYPAQQQHQHQQRDQQQQQQPHQQQQQFF